MKELKTDCPRCNSKQAFAPHLRPTSLVGLKYDVLERYLRCPMCQWEAILSYTTSELEVVTRLRIGLQRRGRAERDRLGQIQNPTKRGITKLVYKEHRLRQTVNRRVLDAKRANDNSA